MIIQPLKGNCVTIEISKSEIPFMLEELQKVIAKLVKELVPSIYIVITN